MVKEIISGAYSRDRIEEAKEVIANLPEGVEYDIKDFASRVRNLSYSPTLIPEFVAIVPEASDQLSLLNTSVERLKKYGRGRLNEADVTAFEQGLQSTLLTADQQAGIIENVRSIVSESEN